MYEELLKALRCCAENNCGECGYARRDIPNGDYCVDKLIPLAVNAIEELNRAQKNWIEQERNALLKSIPRWISVEERLPEIKEPVLAMVHWDDFGDTMMCYGCRYKTRWYLWNCVEGELLKNFTVTHWMPLPEPPEEATT